MNRSVRRVICLPFCVGVFAGMDGAMAQETKPSFERPAYQGLRYHENWSGLKGQDRLATGDFLDPIKYVPLSDDGDIWASFGGQVRLRIEAWDDFNFGADAAGTAAFAPNDDSFLLSRILLHADAHFGKHVRVFVEGKSSLSTDRDLLGGRRNLDVDQLDLQNGFVDIMFPLGDIGATATLRAGRQEMAFGKQRLVSPLDWTNVRRTFDGFSAIVKTGVWTLTPFWTIPVAVEKYHFNSVRDDQFFTGVYATGRIPSTLVSLDLYWLYLDKDATTFNGIASVPTRFNGTAGDERRHTLGGRIGGKVGNTGLDYDLEGAYQLGELGASDIDAFMVSTQGGYTLADVATTPRFYVGFDYASGDHAAGGDVETFNQLFPLAHAYFGWLDQIGRQNIVSLNPGVTIRPIQRLTIDLAGHLFWRAEGTDGGYSAGGALFRPPGAGLSHEVGSEFDLLIRYQVDRHTEVQFGYSHFVAGDFVEQSGPSKDIDFIYAAVQFTF
jgi:hypothetical protein